MFMTWGVFAVIALGLLLTYIIWQETRSHLHWRALVAQGNVWAIHELVCAEIERWHRMRPPRGVALALWAGVQTVELVAIGSDYVQVACGTEGEYRMVGTRREQVVSPLHAAMRLAAKAIEMLMYDIPEVKLGLVRVDVYSTFPTAGGSAEQGCILSVSATRPQANAVDWDATSAEEALKHFDVRCAVDEQGEAARIEPPPPLESVSVEAAMPPEVREQRRRDRKVVDD
jgi:hypothetical protein